jgi:competence ComEA-like helix-hairpin-helix protein
MGVAGISVGPAKWAALAVLGTASLAGLAWSISRPRASQEIRELPAAQPQALMQKNVAERAGVHGVDHAGSDAAGAVSQPVKSEPVEPITVAPRMVEPMVVQRSAKGPAVEEGQQSEEHAATPATDAGTEPAPAATSTSQEPKNAAPRAKENTVKTPQALVSPRRVNVNTASKAELELLPGIGPALADRIIEARGKKKLKTWQDLDAVKGIGPKLLEKLKPVVVFEDAVRSDGAGQSGK